MGGSVIFYTYGSTLELNGQQLTAGMLTADLLNLSPDEYMLLKKRMTQITDLAKEYERKWDVALWWKLNEKMDALCQKLRRYQVFRLLLDEDEDAFCLSSNLERRLLKWHQLSNLSISFRQSVAFANARTDGAE